MMNEDILKVQAIIAQICAFVEAERCDICGRKKPRWWILGTSLKYCDDHLPEEYRDA